MSLDSAAKRRYARHILLGEIGELGQERLLAARFRSGRDVDEDACAAAAEYLERAGCDSGEDGEELRVPDAEAVLRFAGSPELRGPAATVAGAFAAVEHLKSVLGVGGAGDFPAGLSLSDED